MRSKCDFYVYQTRAPKRQRIINDNVRLTLYADYECKPTNVSGRCARTFVIHSYYNYYLNVIFTVFVMFMVF
jgi:hypothetical protein